MGDRKCSKETCDIFEKCTDKEDMQRKQAQEEKCQCSGVIPGKRCNCKKEN